MVRSSPSEVFFREGVLKICCKFTREHPCRNAISIKLQSNFIEIALRHGYFPVNLLLILRISSHKNTFGWLLLRGFFIRNIFIFLSFHCFFKWNMHKVVKTSYRGFLYNTLSGSFWKIPKKKHMLGITYEHLRTTFKLAIVSF